MGFLFLGNGQYSFSTSDFAIACLLASVYPKFPQTPTDNRYHLQALRHFYILATERRLLVTYDVDTDERIHVPVKVHYSDKLAEYATTPTLLKNDCVSIEVIEERNYQAVLRPTPELQYYIKRKHTGGSKTIEQPDLRFL